MSLCICFVETNEGQCVVEQLDTCTGVVEGERSCLLDKECGNMEKCCSDGCYTECSNLIEDTSMYNEKISLFYPFFDGLEDTTSVGNQNLVTMIFTKMTLLTREYQTQGGHSVKFS